jgi:hypothetical protein
MTPCNSICKLYASLTSLPSGRTSSSFIKADKFGSFILLTADIKGLAMDKNPYIYAVCLSGSSLGPQSPRGNSSILVASQVL